MEADSGKRGVSGLETGEIVDRSLIGPSAASVIGLLVAESHICRRCEGERDTGQELLFDFKLESGMRSFLPDLRLDAHRVERFLAPDPGVVHPDPERSADREPGVPRNKDQRFFPQMPRRAVYNSFCLFAFQFDHLPADFQIDRDLHRIFDLEGKGIGLSLQTQIGGITPFPLSGFPEFRPELRLVIRRDPAPSGKRFQCSVFLQRRPFEGDRSPCGSVPPLHPGTVQPERSVFVQGDRSCGRHHPSHTEESRDQHSSQHCGKLLPIDI